MPPSPLIVEITRGPAVESTHIVHAVVLDCDGKKKAVYGKASRPTFPRSAIKPLQAISLMESGAAAAFSLTEEEIALACASHSGEDVHAGTAGAWLSRLGLDEAALECGAHAPYAAPCQPAAILRNNCSGKHSGMVTLALHLNASVRGYTDPNHPVQQAILATLGEMCGKKLSPAVCGIDGCSAPNPVMPLESMARGFAKFMNPAKETMMRGTACRHLFTAMTQHPELVGGTGRLDTVLMKAAQGKIMCKIGGEGVYAAVIPGKDTVIALKAEDGHTRAAQAALFGLLEKHDLADGAVLQATRPVALPVQKNWRGFEVGEIRIKA